MVHPLVDQVRFARAAFVRTLRNVGGDDARRRLGPMNSLGWTVGHLADQEQRYLLVRQGRPQVAPGLAEFRGPGRPASTPTLAELWRAWKAVAAATDPFLDAGELLAPPPVDGPPPRDSIGTLLPRVAAHSWFHNGEAQAIRQLIEHRNLPDFIGAVGKRVPYRPEPRSAVRRTPGRAGHRPRWAA